MSVLSLVVAVALPLGSTPEWIAHRGGVVDDQRIEHSVPAIEEAIHRGYWMIEVDIRRSRDGHPIVHHDPDFRRYYHDPRRVSELTWEQIQQLRSQPGNLRPLDLAEVAAVCRGQTRLMLDIKEADVDKPFVAAIDRTLSENQLLDSAYLLGPDAAKQYFGRRLKASIDGMGLRAAIERREDVASGYFLFDIAANLDDSIVHLARQHQVDVVPAVNTFRYRGDLPWQQAAADIQRLRGAGVFRFQIDSVYEPWFAPRAVPQPVLSPRGHVSSAPGELPGSPVLAKSLGDAAETVQRWQPPADGAAWTTRRTEVRQAFARALGLDPLPDRSPLNARLVSEHPMHGYVIENLVFESRPSLLVTANVYRPSEAVVTRHPAVLCPIGHHLSAGKTASDVQKGCIQLAKLGFVVLVYDAIGQGERMTAGNNHHDAGYALLPLSETIAGWMVWDSIRAIDYLQSRADVDPGRIGMAGNSGGGLNTLFTAALDDRVQVAVVIGFTFEWSNWLKYGGTHCTCTHVPGLFRSMGWFEIAGLIAPRRLMMLHGQADHIFPITGARHSGRQVEAIYRRLNQPNSVRFVELPAQPHAYSRAYREAVYGWMACQLQNRSTADPIDEGHVEALSEQDPRLLIDRDHHLLEGSPTVTQLAARKARHIVDQLPRTPTSADRDALQSWVHRLAAPVVTPSCDFAPEVRPMERESGPGELVSFYSEDGQRIPGWLWLPAACRPVTGGLIVANGRGKRDFASSGLVEALVHAGYCVMAVDLRGRGESLDYFQSTWNINFRLTANQVLMGSPLAGRRAYDLIRTVEYLSSRTDLALNEISVLGIGDDGLSALLAAAVDQRIQQVAIADYVHSFIAQMQSRPPGELSQMAEHWNDPQLTGQIHGPDHTVDFGAVIPEVLLHGDVPDIARLVSPRRLLFCAARDARVVGREGDTARKRWSDLAEESADGCVRYEPASPLDPDLLIGWLRQVP